MARVQVTGSSKLVQPMSTRKKKPTPKAAAALEPKAKGNSNKKKKKKALVELVSDSSDDAEGKSVGLKVDVE